MHGRIGDLSYRLTMPISAAQHDDHPPVRLRAHGLLTPPTAGDVLVTASVGPSGEAITLWADPDAQQSLLKPSGLDGSCANRPVLARVVIQSSSTTTVTALADLDLPFCHVQPLPGGQILVVAARGGAAAIFDVDGAPLRRGRVSDGIEHVLTSAAGNVWIGYFDEGVYGNDPAGHHGIVRYTADLEPDWMYPYDTGFGPVDDCYTLNVEGETAWSCYYSGFPIVRMSERTVTGWRNTISGARALIATSDTCALIGGYAERRNRVVPGRLGEGRYEPASDAPLVLPDGRCLPERTRMVGRGPELHVFTEATWYRLSLDDLV
jgi:hypothetical protein